MVLNKKYVKDLLNHIEKHRGIGKGEWILDLIKVADALRHKTTHWWNFFSDKGMKFETFYSRNIWKLGS